jgi:hypothetical protein
MHQVQEQELHVYQKQEDHYRKAGAEKILQSMPGPYGTQGNEVRRRGVPEEIGTGQ